MFLENLTHGKSKRRVLSLCMAERWRHIGSEAATLYTIWISGQDGRDQLHAPPPLLQGNMNAAFLYYVRDVCSFNIGIPLHITKAHKNVRAKLHDFLTQMGLNKLYAPAAFTNRSRANGTHWISGCSLFWVPISELTCRDLGDLRRQ